MVRRSQSPLELSISHPEQPAEIVVVRFVRKANGELRCRLTDALTNRVWVLDPATDLWNLIFPPDEDAV